MADDKVVTELRSELWEKERKLTDIRLEALSSAHRLEQLQEAMSNMQVCGCGSSPRLSSLQFYLQKNKIKAAKRRDIRWISHWRCLFSAEDGGETEGGEQPAENGHFVPLPVSRAQQFSPAVLKPHGRGAFVTSTVGGCALTQELQQRAE